MMAIIRFLQVVVLTGLCACVFGLIRNEVVGSQRSRIIDAIHKYHLDCLRKDVEECVSYCDMETYDDTMLRFWDFGYTNILPKDKFEIIKPYIDDYKQGPKLY